jgi:CTP:molybdopterin cytidylyltransferase MocA
VTVLAVILAAGGGTRFEGAGPKLLASVRGRPLVGWAVASAIGAALDEVVVVQGSVDLTQVLPPGVLVLTNERWAEGQASSLATAIAHGASVGHEAIVVGLGDQPGLEPSAWRAVAATTGSPIAVATYDGRRGHPVRLASSIWEQLPADGDEGASALMRGRPDLVSEVPCLGRPDDVDTLEDLDRWS